MQFILRRFWILLFPISALLAYRYYLYQQERINKKDKLLADIFSHTTDVIVLYSDNRVIQTNQSFRDLLNYEEVIGLKLNEFFPDIQECEETGGGRYVWYTKNGNEINVQVLLTKNEHNHTKLLLSRNMTDTIKLKSALRKTKKQLLRSQKMELAGRFMNSVIHDFNNILQIISSRIQIIEEDPASIDEQIPPIQSAISKSEDLIDQLLLFAKSSSDFKQDIIDINREIKGTRQLINNVIPNNIEIDYDLPDTPLKTKINRSQLDQVLINLIVNAKEAMPEGGRIKIRTTDIKKDNLDYILITVEDTGTGMDQHTLDHLYDPFFTTKGYGTGLGLFTVYTVISQYKGEIKVQSSIGEGTRFEIYLPRLH